MTTRRPPLVIREPEEGWWETQEAQDRRAARAMTVAVLRDQDAGTATVALLARLAVADELLVVLGSASSGRAVVAGLRGSLPRQDVVPVHIRHRDALDRNRQPATEGDEMRRHSAALAWILDAGSLPVAVTASATVHDVAAQISSHVRADRVLRIFRTAAGADSFQVWRRPEPRSGDRVELGHGVGR
jgi:hypothetical protein